MIVEYIESLLLGTTASSVSEIVCISIFIFLAIGLISLRLGTGRNFVAYTPALLTTLGIFGTFVGIVIGLLEFDASNIDDSIEGLLAGLKTAFLTSLLGIITSILFKIIQTSGLISARVSEEQQISASPEEILTSINKQREAITSLVTAVGGDSDSSILSQIKLLRGDINDNQKIEINTQQEILATLGVISTHVSQQSEDFKHFSDKLWIKMQDFADMLSKSATETVIEALKQVITDFNNNLTEQFGDNFKQLNDAVKELVVWQDNYRVQISDMIEQYKQGVISINATEASVLAISNESKVIPQTMLDLKQVMEVNQHQLTELEQHLEAFKDIRDKAVEAVPEIRKQIDETVSAISKSVTTASEHYSTLLSESDKYIQSHIASSNELLDKFVTKTSDGVDVISKKLSESAIQVEKVITEGANEFTDKVHQTNTSLQTTADHLDSQTEVIKNYLKDAVDDLNNHVRDMVNGLVEDSKTLSTTLIEANKSLVQETGSVRDSVVDSINGMQSRFESSLDELSEAQRRQMNNVFSNLDSALKEQVGQSGQAVEKQLSILDQAVQQELNTVMNGMGTALGRISNQFVQDYGRLTAQMDLIVRKAS
ncbi:MotA/TolQ/ExbB proton channel family protein [Methylophaga thiooxydans]|uniref:Uncharacterized protein n=1 Tax=Methylophaga thiooxydans DMS010 TaxID=637616 RepID=C0N453_9GAMM|nr:MotA/TolQ/ExbB proton channel family protein [Methylophaga thiooxydans]EEF80486.1 hypothetical protein MDMS009_811 [Methylophaga thiooxydans DMS010]